MRGLVRLGGGAQQQQPGPNPDSVAIRSALLPLPLAQRTVVALHHVLDLPVEDIAVELEIPVGTVKSRLSRGRAALSDADAAGLRSRTRHREATGAATHRRGLGWGGRNAHRRRRPRQRSVGR